VALELAAADRQAPVAYLSRPCQYLDAAELATCTPAYWTSARFAPEVVEAYQQALDQLLSVSGVRRLSLVGYSGGGVLAALLAARRDDVVQLITVAAPLSVAAWTAHHDLTPLQGLDPGTLDGRWPPAVHFAGDKDEVVPVAVVAPHARRTGARLVAIPGFDHECCWARDWPRLLEENR
jgi:pimeloyl-ACP methyl ester carboxylesterase